MSLDDVQRLSWSITQRAVAGNRDADQAFDDLAAACRDLCASHFPDDDGYEATRFELSGPIQGTRWVVKRGRLRVMLSLQRFERAHAAPVRGKRPVEIRLVASMGMLPSPSVASERTMAVWGVAGCALGTLGVSALALGSVGILSAWMQAAFIVPSLVAWRTCATIGIARTVRRQAALGEARAQIDEEALRDALPRWRRMAPALLAERDRIGERLGLPPFRSPAPAVRSVSASASSSAA